MRERPYAITVAPLIGRRIFWKYAAHPVTASGICVAIVLVQRGRDELQRCFLGEEGEHRWGRRLI